MLKKSFFIFHIVFLSLASLLLAESRTTDLVGTRVCGLNQRIYESTTYYDLGAYDLGNDNNNTGQYYWRSIWSFNLSELANATSISSVLVSVATASNPTGSSNYTINILDGFNSNSSPDYRWQQIDDGTPTSLSFTYGQHNNVSSSTLSQQLFGYISDGTLYLGLLNLSYAETDMTNLAYIALTVSYIIPDVAKSFQVRNEIPTYGGTIGVGISSSPSERQSPYYSQIFNNQTANLEAYDNQIIENQEYVFNDTEAPLNKSCWEKIVGSSHINIGDSQTSSISGADISANVILSSNSQKSSTIQQIIILSSTIL